MTRVEPTIENAQRLLKTADMGVGLDDVHRAISPRLLVAAMEVLEAAGVELHELPLNRAT